VAEPAGSPDDPLATLREHLRDAQQAAQQLLHDATETPPSGWASPEPEGGGWPAQELNSLGESLRSLRELLPDELRAQLAELIRQLLEVLRALLEVLLSRLHGPKPTPTSEIQDIPIL
jgi:hypothetical protein